LKTERFSDRTLVYSFDQTQGRGRENRKWINFKNKNLALSVLFKPYKSASNFLWYIAIVSLALIKVLEDNGISKSYIKWPNDIFIGDKKIAGVLAESVWKGDSLDKLIVGIGVNVNSTMEDLSSIDKKATSIFAETGKTVNLKLFTDNYIKSLCEYCDIFFSQGGLSAIKKEWGIKNNVIGKKIKWIFNGKEILGTAVDADEDGFLLMDDGSDIIKILSGDVVLI